MVVVCWLLVSELLGRQFVCCLLVASQLMVVVCCCWMGSWLAGCLLLLFVVVGWAVGCCLLLLFLVVGWLSFVGC